MNDESHGPALLASVNGLMHRERFEERKSEGTRSLGRLGLVCQMTESEVIRDATIQRFEFTFEVVWKALKQYLEHQGLVCGGPRPTLRQAFSEGLIGSPEEADGWFQMVDDRNLSSHAYDEATPKRSIGAS